jgi:hypothetical protein
MECRAARRSEAQGERPAAASPRWYGRLMRSYCARWTAAEATLLVAWAALATGLLAHGLARDSLGALLLGGFAVWQMCHVWETVHRSR